MRQCYALRRKPSPSWGWSRIRARVKYEIVFALKIQLFNKVPCERGKHPTLMNS
jgi:hypothetical protein